MSTSDVDSFDRDDELRALLRSGDPAASLHPADPAALAGLLEDIMSADLDVRPAPDQVAAAGDGRRRSGLTWLVAAAAAAVIAGAGGFAVSNLGGEDPAPPTAGEGTTAVVPSETAPSAEVPAPASDAPPAARAPYAPMAGQTTELTAGPQQAKCAEARPTFLAQYPQAFQAEVDAIDEAAGTVTLTATDVYAGEVGETVVVSGRQDLLGAMIGAVQFQVGGTYNVAVYRGQVALCGYSGPAAGRTEELFREAFLR